MSKITIYTPKGKETKRDLPSQMQENINDHLLAQAIHVYRNRLHTGRSKTKTRSDVVASTAKIYRQKGTGRARHGAISAPIFIGGGKAHGAKFEKRILTLPKKMKKKALFVALSLKAKEGKIVLVDSLRSIKKTKEARDFVDKIKKTEKSIKEKNKITLCLAKENSKARLFFRNLPDVQVKNFDDLNAYTVFYSNVLAIDKDNFKTNKKSKVSKKISKNKK